MVGHAFLAFGGDGKSGNKRGGGRGSASESSSKCAPVTRCAAPCMATATANTRNWRLVPVPGAETCACNYIRCYIWEFGVSRTGRSSCSIQCRTRACRRLGAESWSSEWANRPRSFVHRKRFRGSQTCGRRITR